MRTLQFESDVPKPDNHCITALTPDGDERGIAPITTTDDSVPVPTAAVVHDDVVLVGVDELVQAFERATGDQIWGVVVGEQVAGVAPTPERVYVRAAQSVAVVTVDGRRWVTAFEPVPERLAVGAEGVYVTADGRLFRLDPDSGEVAWRRELPTGGDGAGVDRLLTVPGGLLVHRQSGHLTACTTAGSLVWRTDGIGPALATDGTTLYAGRPEASECSRSRTVRFSGSARAVASRAVRIVGHRCSMAATTDSVSVALGGDQFVVFASRDGTVRWQRTTSERVARLALTGDAVYAVGEEPDPLVRVTG